MTSDVSDLKKNSLKYEVVVLAKENALGVVPRVQLHAQAQHPE